MMPPVPCIATRGAGRFGLAALLAAGLLACGQEGGGAPGDSAPDAGSSWPPDVSSLGVPADQAHMAPELDGGLAWLNVAEPLRLEDLRGHVVLIDFWTYGCVNCLHLVPVLRELEAKYADRPFLVLGVHSGKFHTEQQAATITDAIAHYDIHHPVVVDDEYAIWEAYGVFAWPTAVFLDAEGRIRHRRIGEFLADDVTPQIDELLAEAHHTGVAADGPPDLYVDPNADSTTPLLYPGKVLAMPDGRVVISDSAHHRLVIATSDGEVDTLIGSGIEGLVDGTFAASAFRRPQGIALWDGRLYVADTENHVLRVVDFEAATVETVAGVGTKGAYYHKVAEGWIPGDEAELRSPWDLEAADGGLAIALAGSHQLGFFDPIERRVRILSGSGKEKVLDGDPASAAYAQPSGLALTGDGDTLYVADSESSAIRAIQMEDGHATTLVGTGLFDYGDEDGVGTEALLQHPIGVEVMPDQTVLIADTYNSKLKLLDPGTLQVTTLDWGIPEPGLYQPRGLSRLGSIVYITDTNHHRVLRHDLDTGETVVFEIAGLEPPALAGAVAESD